MIFGNLVCVKTCYSFKPAKPSRWPKTQIPKIVIFQKHPDWCLGACWPKKLPIYRERFWAIIFSLDRNDINNFGPKGQPFKTILTRKEMLQLGRPSVVCIVARSRQIIWIEKKRKKEKLIVMSCTWKIRLSLNKNQESWIQKKNEKTA